MCGTMNSLLYRWLLYALDLYPSVLAKYINLLPLATLFLPSLPNLTGCPLYYLSTADDRTKEFVKHIHNVRNSQRSSNRDRTHTHQHNSERCCDYDPIRTADRVRRRAATNTLHSLQKFNVRPLAVCWSADTLGWHECYDKPCDGIHPLSTRFVSFSHLYIFFVVYVRFIHPLVLQGCHREGSQ